MGRGRLSVVAVVLLSAVVVLAASGAGKASQQRGGKLEIQRAETSGFLDLGREKGYRIYLTMPNERVVALVAVSFRSFGEESGGLAYSIYATRNRAKLRHGVVRARFGNLGRVSLRFRPDGRVRRDDPQGGCEGGVEVTERGRFVGHISFRGPGNYFHLGSPKGEAAIERSPRLKCEKGEADEPAPKSLRSYVAFDPLFSDRESIALLYASARSHGRYVGITAMHREGSPPGADVELGVVEPRHGMAIGHGLYLSALQGTLLTSPPGSHPATATLAPPRPFYGKADYSEEAGTWTGTLGVRLAGLKLPLTGPDFKVHLCVSNPLKDRDDCEFFKKEPPFFERPARLSRLLR